MKTTTILPTLLTGLFLLSACAPSGPASPTPPAPATATLFVQAASTAIATGTPILVTLTPGAFTAIAASAVTPPPAASDICADPRATALIDSLKSSMLKSDGSLLSSLVSPPRGLDAAYFRDGTVINYRSDQAKFLFETTFEVNWGSAPGSGAEKIGSFHDVIVPELVKIFNQPYTLHCNELKHGGASYELKWPYQQGFYSVFFPGTNTNGNLDWHTWAVGIEYVNNKPYLYALIPFFWEP